MASNRRSLAERREQLLDAAFEVMSAGGVRAGTTRSITGQAGVPHGVFHYCFDSKSDLIRAMLGREIERVRADERANAEHVRTLDGWLHSTLMTRLRQAMDTPKREIVLAELALLARTDDTIAQHIQWEQERYTEVVRAALLLRAPKLTAQNRDGLAYLIVVSMSGIIDQWLLDRDDKRAQTAVRLLSQGCYAVATTPAPMSDQNNPNIGSAARIGENL
jgi:AcrR family transcriptional regulator